MAPTEAPSKSDKAPKGDPLPKEPPAEEFWQKYSPHYEFPLSNVVSVTLHVVMIVCLFGLRDGLMEPDQIPPVPVHGMKIASGSAGGTIGSQGAKSGDREAADDEQAADPQKPIPDVDFKKAVEQNAAWLPDLKDNSDVMRKIVQSPGFKSLDKVNDDLKQRLGKGFGGNAKDGGKEGKGGGGTADKGLGDSDSSGSRSMRWVIIFKTQNGEDYLKQLHSFKAKVVIPEPPDWKSNLLFEDILGSKQGKKLAGQDLPEMYFTDSDKTSASKVSRALGLNYDVPYFIAFFPKDVEQELAAKEQAFRGLKGDQIFSTTFRVLERNGSYVITVTDQEKNKKR